MNTLLFFCDVQGTITNNNKEVNKLDMIELFKKISNYASSVNCSKVIFSLVSSDNVDTLLNTFLKLPKNFDNIEFGKQFYEDGYFLLDKNEEILKKNTNCSSKLENIQKYTDLLLISNNIKNVCYADDITNNLYLLILQRMFPKILIQSIKTSSSKIEIGSNYFETSVYGINGLLSLLKISTKINYDLLDINNDKIKKY